MSMIAQYIETTGRMSEKSLRLLRFNVSGSVRRGGGGDRIQRPKKKREND